jgi:hypothetical protein
VDAQFVLTYVPDSVNVHASDPVGRSEEARIPVPPQEIVAAVPCTVIVPVVNVGVHMAPVEVVTSGHACAPARDATLPATAQVKWQYPPNVTTSPAVAAAVTFSAASPVSGYVPDGQVMTELADPFQVPRKGTTFELIDVPLLPAALPAPDGAAPLAETLPDAAPLVAAVEPLPADPPWMRIPVHVPS